MINDAPEAVASQLHAVRGRLRRPTSASRWAARSIKDKLWFYAGFAPQMTFNARTKYYQSRTLCNPAAGPCSGAFQLDQYGQFVMTPIAGTATGYGSGFDRYFAIAKVTWLINENHNMFVSFNTQPTTTYGIVAANGNNSANSLATTDNTTNATLNYTGKFLDKHLLLEVKGGWFNATSTENATNYGGVNNLQTPQINWITNQPLANFVPGFTCPLSNAGACNVSQYFTGGAGYSEAPKSNRYAGSAALTGLFDLAGQHQLKAGVQIDYATYQNDRIYTGGAAIRARNSSTAAVSANNSFQIFRSYGNPAPGSEVSPGKFTNWCASIDANGNCVNPGLKDPTNPGSLGRRDQHLVERLLHPGQLDDRQRPDAELRRPPRHPEDAVADLAGHRLHLARAQPHERVGPPRPGHLGLHRHRPRQDPG